MPSIPKLNSTNSIYFKKWIESGKIIPICINHGCDNYVAIRHWSIQGKPSLKTECSKCSNMRIKGKTIRGIIFHKKNYCENKDNIFGFTCPMDKSRYNEFPSDIYDMDHKDGDHFNNTPENLITICKICHARKGKEQGDFNSQKKSSMKPKKEITNSAKKETFDMSSLSNIINDL